MAKNRILIVEDEEAIAKMIAMNLEVSNYDTQIYYNGLEAEQSPPRWRFHTYPGCSG